MIRTSLLHLDPATLSNVLSHVYADDLARLLGCGNHLLQRKMRSLKDVVINIRYMNPCWWKHPASNHHVCMAIQRLIAECDPLDSLVLRSDKAHVDGFSHPLLFNHAIILDRHASSLKHLSLRRVWFGANHIDIASHLPNLKSFGADHWTPGPYLFHTNGWPTNLMLTSLHFGPRSPAFDSDTTLPPNLTSLRVCCTFGGNGNNRNGLSDAIKRHQTPLMDFSLRLESKVTSSITPVNHPVPESMAEFIHQCRINLSLDQVHTMAPPSNTTLANWINNTYGYIRICIKCTSPHPYQSSNDLIINTSVNTMPLREASGYAKATFDEHGRLLTRLKCANNTSHVEYATLIEKHRAMAREVSKPLVLHDLFTYTPRDITSLKLTSYSIWLRVDFDALKDLPHLLHLAIGSDIQFDPKGDDMWPLPLTLPSTISELTLGHTMPTVDAHNAAYQRKSLCTIVVPPKSVERLKIGYSNHDNMSRLCDASVTPNLKHLTVHIGVATWISNPPSYWPKRWPSGLQSLDCSIENFLSNRSTRNRMQDLCSVWTINLASLPKGIQSVVIDTDAAAVRTGQLLLVGSGRAPRTAVVSICGYAPDRLSSPASAIKWLTYTALNGRQLTKYPSINVTDVTLLLWLTILVGRIWFVASRGAQGMGNLVFNVLLWLIPVVYMVGLLMVRCNVSVTGLRRVFWQYLLRMFVKREDNHCHYSYQKCGSKREKNNCRG